MGASSGIYAVTLWTAGRMPTLVSFDRRGVAVSLLGRLVLERWGQLASAFRELTIDEFAILPDRFRAVVHCLSPADLELSLAWFRAAVAQEARLAGLSQSGVVWESGGDIIALESADELMSWRRRIRAGRALGLSGSLPTGVPPAPKAAATATRG